MCYYNGNCDTHTCIRGAVDFLDARDDRNFLLYLGLGGQGFKEANNFAPRRAHSILHNHAYNKATPLSLLRRAHVRASSWSGALRITGESG